MRLIELVGQPDETREVGVVTTLKEGFGFIKCADRDGYAFFHFSEFVETVSLQLSWSHVLQCCNIVMFVCM